MKAFLLKFLLPFALGVALFAGLAVHRDGWQTLTSNGTDPWAIIFYALGGVFAPTISTLLIIVIIKLFRRTSIILNLWPQVFIPVTVIWLFPYLMVTLAQN